MKMAVQRIQAEATEELKRVSGAALRREKEHEEIINKFQVKIMTVFSTCGVHVHSLNLDLIIQEDEKERSTLVETLRSKLVLFITIPKS